MRLSPRFAARSSTRVPVHGHDWSLMQIAFNALSLRPENAGGRRMLVQLIRTLDRIAPEHQYRVICTRESLGLFEETGPEVVYVVVPLAGPSVLRVLHDQVTVPLLTRSRVDVLVTPATVGSIFCPVPQVVIVAAQFAIPSIRRALPDVHISTLHRLYFGPIMRFTHRRVASIVPISNFMADHLIGETGAPRNKITVIPLGVEPSETSPDPEPNVLLFVGSLSVHKNVETLVKAFSIAQSRLPPRVTLVIAGRDLTGQHKSLLDDLASRLGVKDSVNVLGRVDETELESLYAKALALVAPSHAEGFGLPVLEAMVRSVPVLASNRTALPEVVGHAGLFFDPDSADQLAELLVSVTTDTSLRTRMIEAGLARADFLSWVRTGKEFLNLFDALLRDPDSGEALRGHGDHVASDGAARDRRGRPGWPAAVTPRRRRPRRRATPPAR